MKKKRNLWMLAFVMSLLVLDVGGIYGRTSTEETDSVVMDKVDIYLEGLELVQENEIPWQESLAVLPGDSISRILRITNRGTDCYVRAKIQWLTEARDVTEALAEVQWLGMEEDWILGQDGYLYYQKVLSRGAQVELFQGLRFPVTLSQKDWELKTIRMTIGVDAIQSSHLEPDYSQKEPWGEVEIPQHAENDALELPQRTPEKSQPQNTVSVETGDPSMLNWYLVLLACAAGVAVWAAIMLKKRKEDG